MNLMLYVKKLLFYIILSNYFNQIYTNNSSWKIGIPVEQNHNIKEILELDLTNFSIEHKIFFEELNLGACFILNNLYITEIGFNNFKLFLSYKIYTNEFEYFNFNLNILSMFSFNKKILKDIVVRIEFYNIFMSRYFNFSIDFFILNQQIFIYYYGFIVKKNFKIYSKLNLIKIVNLMKGENKKQNINENYTLEQKNDLEKLKNALKIYDATYNETEQIIKFNLNKEKNLPEETFSVKEFFEKSEKLRNRINKQYKSLCYKYHPDRNTDPEATNKFTEIGFLHDYINKT